MKGYKAFDKELKCRDMQYEIGKEFSMNEEPILCNKGFHFCTNIADVYKFYPITDDTRICEVEAIGEVATEDGIKYCTNKIRIIKEITEKEIKHCNADKSVEGFFNTGNCNTGNWNTGNRNTGSWNTGGRNTGSWNTGICNTGNCNTGNWNTGNRNTGSWNTGSWNTGDYNIGNRNTGNHNTGDCNTGDYNTGDYNTGDYNTGDNSTGCFCTEKKTIEFFDKPSDLKYSDWLYSKERNIINSKPSLMVEWIREIDMSDEEKINNPTYKTTGGYLKVYDETETAQKWWDGLSDDDKQCVMNLPNFNADKFYKCTGIKVK